MSDIERQLTAAYEQAFNAGGKPTMYYWLDEYGETHLFETDDDGKTWHEVAQ